MILIAMAAMREEEISKKREGYKQPSDLKKPDFPGIVERTLLLADSQHFHGYFPAEAVHDRGPDASRSSL